MSLFEKKFAVRRNGATFGGMLSFVSNFGPRPRFFRVDFGR
jgi:hypothetical protein